MSEWVRKKLGDLISIKGGYSYKGEFIGKGETLLLGMGCVSFNDIFLTSGARHYSGETPDTFLVKPGDIVLATRQQSDNLPILGAPALIPNHLSNKRVIVGTNLYKIENKSDVSNKFLFCLLRSEEYRNHIDSCSKGSTVKMITKDAVESYEFLCAGKGDREKISGMLWNIQDKIDLLHRQNKTLEAIAETLFRQRFVEGGGDWVEGKLRDVLELVYGKALKDEIRTGSGFPVVGSSGVVGYHAEYLVEGPGIVIGRKGTLGKVNYLFENFFPIDTTYYIRSKIQSAGLFYEYFLLKTINFENSDSAVPGLNRDIALGEEIKIPPMDLVKDFNLTCSSIFSKLKANAKQIGSLEKMRDSLLPKLMSGEVRIA